MESKRDLSRPLHDKSKRARLEHHPHSSTLQSTYGVPMSLNLGCRVFLSHSGQDKEFVRFLYDELCSRYHDNKVAFFDAKTLPKAEAVSMENILEEARASHLGVLVLTEAFFSETPNPMLELEAFQASKVKLLPLFFGMTVNEFKEKSRNQSWEEKWRSWLAKRLGGRSNIEEVIETWRQALNLVTTFFGLEYKKIATNHLEYIHKIVDEVTCIIPPTILFSEEGVCGKDRLCQMVNNMYENCVLKRSAYVDQMTTQVASTSVRSCLGEERSGYTELDLVGIFGFSGLGKTTLCKSLCDFYFAQFKGKVCYIDLGSMLADQVSSQKHAFSSHMWLMVSMLGIDNTNDFLQSQDIDQVKNLFRKQIFSMKDSIFMAIDNVLPDNEYQEEVDFYLSCEFPKGSRIFITSRSESILTNLASQHNCNFSCVIEYMPTLEFNEAREIFMGEFSELRKFGFSNVVEDVNKCVEMCTFHTTHYHPLMLKSLAASIKWDRSTQNLNWKERLAKLHIEEIVDKDNVWKEVFNMFDMTFAMLNEDAQRVFLDLALFYDATHNNFKMYNWIKMLYSHLHEKKMDKIILQLQDLCFIDKKGCNLTILDLLVDYGKYKARKGVNSEYVVVDGTHWLDDLPRSARTISISRCGHDMMAIRMLDLRDMERVKVLHIVDNLGLQEVLLSRTSCAHLRSLIVRVPASTSMLYCTCDGDWSSTSADIGGCLQWVELEGNVCFRSSRLSVRRSLMTLSKAFFDSLKNFQLTSTRGAIDLVSVLGGLRKLEILTLSKLPSMQSIDVTTYTNLKKLTLYEMQMLKLINGLENPNMESVSIFDCDEVLALTIPADSKTTFDIIRCKSLERISFCTVPSYNEGAISCTGAGYLHIRGCPTFTNVDGLSQYTGSFTFHNCEPKNIGRIWSERFGDLLKPNAGVDYSLCKAKIKRLELAGYNPEGLAGAKVISLQNAQHIGLLISALFKAEPKNFRRLEIYCKEGGDCGCDQNVPHFGHLPNPGSSGESQFFEYCCPQVKDLASLTQWHGLKELSLSGCKSVEMWPDFAAMTSLMRLDLGDTSLKEWPAGVERLSYLVWLNMQGCRQLPAKELTKGVTFDQLQPVELGNWVCTIGSLQSLQYDLRAGKKDRCSVADALDGVYAELVALFDRSPWSLLEVIILQLVVEIMYDVWPFGEGEVGMHNNMRVGAEADEAQQELQYIRKKMRRLLCSKSFWLLPFAACSQSLLSSAPILPRYAKPRVCSYRMGGKDHDPILEGVQQHIMAFTGLMGIALVGESLAAGFDALADDDLQDHIMVFLQSFTQDTHIMPEVFREGTSLYKLQLGYNYEVRVILGLVQLSQCTERVLKERVEKAMQTLSGGTIKPFPSRNWDHSKPIETFVKPVLYWISLERA